MATGDGTLGGAMAPWRLPAGAAVVPMRVLLRGPLQPSHLPPKHPPVGGATETLHVLQGAAGRSLTLWDAVQLLLSEGRAYCVPAAGVVLQRPQPPPADGGPDPQALPQATQEAVLSGVAVGDVAGLWDAPLEGVADAAGHPDGWLYVALRSSAPLRGSAAGAPAGFVDHTAAGGAGSGAA